MKKEGIGKDFDCIIEVSSELDSSYLANIATVKFGYNFYCFMLIMAVILSKQC